MRSARARRTTRIRRRSSMRCAASFATAASRSSKARARWRWIVSSRRSSRTATEASDMLLELADLLKGYVSGFHLFQYLTFRTIMSTLTALAVSLLAGPAIIRKLAEIKAGQVIRSDGPQSHLTKAGTPTMGGALSLGSIVAATLLW